MWDLIETEDQLKLTRGFEGRGAYGGCVCHEGVSGVRLDFSEHEIWNSRAGAQIEGVL